MSEHYFVAADHGHLRIFVQRQAPGQREPDLDEVEAMDFPAGRQSYVARETSMAGRFQGSQHQSTTPGASSGIAGRRAGTSIDERFPMQREEERRRVRDVAEEIDVFFAAPPGATWDFAGGPELQNTVLDRLSEGVRRRLRRAINRNLVNQRPEDVRALFVAPAPR